jgi:uncharacterized membrane protein HdeD (DUF308 family)
MSVAPVGELRMALRHELGAIRGKWFWFLALGIVLIILGTIAIGTPWLIGKGAVLFLGVLLMGSGISQAVAAFWTRNWSGFFYCLLSGIFYFVLGFIFVRRPIDTQAALTLLIAVFLLVGGIFRIVAALVYRFSQWGWVVVSGIVTVVLGDLILADWPQSSFWVIGTFLGIDMILHGWSWLMLSLALRRLPTPAA